MILRWRGLQFGPGLSRATLAPRTAGTDPSHLWGQTLGQTPIRRGRTFPDSRPTPALLETDPRPSESSKITFWGQTLGQTPISARPHLPDSRPGPPLLGTDPQTLRIVEDHPFGDRPQFRRGRTFRTAGPPHRFWGQTPKPSDLFWGQTPKPPNRRRSPFGDRPQFRRGRAFRTTGPPHRFWRQTPKPSESSKITFY